MMRSEWRLNGKWLVTPRSSACSSNPLMPLLNDLLVLAYRAFEGPQTALPRVIAGLSNRSSMSGTAREFVRSGPIRACVG